MKISPKPIVLFRVIAISLIALLWLSMADGVKGNRAALTVVIEPHVAYVRTAGTWQLEFQITEDDMVAGAALKVRFPKGFGKPQSESDRHINYVEVETSSDSGEVVIESIKRTDEDTPWDWDRNAWVVTLRLTRGRIRRGEVIDLTYGANPPHGRMSAPLSTFEERIEIAYDLEGSGKYRVIEDGPRIVVQPELPRQLKAFLPSNATLGEEVNLKLVVMDEYYNLTPGISPSITLRATDASAKVPLKVQLTGNDSGKAEVPVVFNSPGVHSVSVRAIVAGIDSAVTVESNPVLVTAERPQLCVFWGDLHSHSRISHDAHGTGSFAKARDWACLDFYALTDHCSNDHNSHGGITKVEWQETKRNVFDFYQPGTFVTLLAYEYSTTGTSGHHNLYFNGSDAALEQVAVYQDYEYGEVQSLWQALQVLLPPGVEFISVPHHTGIMWSETSSSTVAFGAGFGDPDNRPLIEIYSQHGQSEAYSPGHPLAYEQVGEETGRFSSPGPHYAQDAWAAGEILGTIASSDDHSARPGLDYRGLAAVLAPELTRDAVFEALKHRRTYATTGQRLLLSFEIDGQLMGSRLQMPQGKVPQLAATVHGTDELEFVEILKWSHDNGRRASGHPVFETVLHKAGSGRHLSVQMSDSSYSSDTIYYLRAKQKNRVYDSTRRVFREVWAWSSPIWVNRDLTLDTTGSGTAPQAFRLSPSYPNPAVEQTGLQFYLPRDGRVELKLYDTGGREIMTVLKGFFVAGWHTASVPRAGLSSGIYFATMRTGNQVETRKLLFLPPRK